MSLALEALLCFETHPAEIGKLDAIGWTLTRKQDVLGFDVAVDNVASVAVGQRLCGLPHVKRSVLFAEVLSWLLLQECVTIARRGELQNHVNLGLALEVPEKTQDIAMHQARLDLDLKQNYQRQIGKTIIPMSLNSLIKFKTAVVTNDVCQQHFGLNVRQEHEHVPRAEVVDWILAVARCQS